MTTALNLLYGVGKTDRAFRPVLAGGPTFAGLAVVTNELMTVTHVKKWKTRRRMDVVIKRKVKRVACGQVYRMGDRLIMHPGTWRRLQATLKERTEL